MEHFKLVILGTPKPRQESALKRSISLLVNHYDSEIADNVEVLDSERLRQLGCKGAIVAVYYGSENKVDQNEISQLLENGATIIPVFEQNSKFYDHIPEVLRQFMGIELKNERNSVEISASMLERVGLLGQKRKIFISYVHNDNKSGCVARQLYHVLSDKRFEVFLDMHKIHYGDHFEDTLSKNVIESDLLIALDSENYKSRKMTQFEYELAKNRRISIVKLEWPGKFHSKSAKLDDSHFHLDPIHPIKLECTDFTKHGRLNMKKINEILSEIQILRCLSVVNQHDHIMSRIIEEISRNGWELTGKDAHFSVDVKLKSGVKTTLYPIIGIPTLETLADVVHNANEHYAPYLVYNTHGYTENWKDRLQLLDRQMDNLKIVAIHT